MNLRKKIAIAVIAFLILAQSTAGVQPRPIESVSQDLFSPVVVSTPVSEAFLDYYTEVTVPIARPSIDVPDSKPKIVPTPTPKPNPVSVSGNTLSGVASYYCNADASRGPVSRCHYKYPDGKNSYYAAIKESLHGKLNGKTVQVCVGSKCLPVKIIDCNCGTNPNLIDLYGDAFAYFYPLTKGKFNVTVKW